MTNARWAWLAVGGLMILGGVALTVWFLRESRPTVTGTVRLDGQLLAKGSIALEPIDGTPGPGGGGGIDKDGKYEIRQGLQPGRYRIKIRSTMTTGRQVRSTIPSELVDEEVSVIPEQYNSPQSTLTRVVGPGENVFHFDLKGSAARK
jgi:hypothetical protein